jgi:EAL domain-containing protein (putative c-di-GMP-specific phosphodiesterase class I)
MTDVTARRRTEERFAPVETEEQAAALRAMACRSAQGYLNAKPLPFGEFLDLLARGRGRAAA